MNRYTAIIKQEGKLNALSEFLPEFESPDFEFGLIKTPPGKVPYYTFSDEALRFIKVCYDTGWIQPFNWPEWKESPEAIQLRNDPASLERATPDQIQKLLTVLIRQERFAEGTLDSAFDSGLLVGILRRAQVLADCTDTEGAGELS